MVRVDRTALGLREAVASAFEQRGLRFRGDTSGVSLLIIVSHIVLFLLALGISVPMLIRRRLTWWVPLVAGVVAAVVFWGAIIGLVVGDPSFMNSVSH